MSRIESTNDKNVEYWKKREKAKLDKGLRDIKIVEREMAKEYKKAMENINKEISYLFDKYSKDNQLTYAEANKLLTGTQYKEFKTDLKSYIKEIEATGDELLLQELNTLSMKSRISRLEEIYYQCDKYINELSKTTENSLKMLYSGTVTDNYYQSLYDIHKYIGVGTSFAKVDNDMVRDILSLPWSGKNYSERIWANRTKLKNIVKENITQMVIQGKSSRDIAKDLATKMDADYKNALRLVHTEHSYVMSEATAKAFEETDVDRYQFLATLDTRTSEKCQELDLKIFNLKDRAIGVNASPMHPNCRSTEIPYFDDEEVSTRFARDKNGKGIEVPSNMTYKEWQEAFDIEDISKPVGKVDKSKTFNEKIKEKMTSKSNKSNNKYDKVADIYGDNHSNKCIERYNSLSGKEKEIFDKYAVDDIRKIEGDKGAYYMPGDKYINMGDDRDADFFSRVFMHEQGHSIDWEIGEKLQRFKDSDLHKIVNDRHEYLSNKLKESGDRTSYREYRRKFNSNYYENKETLNISKQDNASTYIFSENDIHSDYMNIIGYGNNKSTSWQKIKDDILLKTGKDVDSYYINTHNGIYGSVSDSLSAISNGSTRGVFSHSRSYWKIEGRKEAEVFAHMQDVYSSNDNDLVYVYEKLLPNLTKKYKKYVSDLDSLINGDEKELIKFLDYELWEVLYG